MTKEEQEYRVAKLVISTTATTIILSVAFMASCSIHGHTYAPERNKHEIEMKKERAKDATLRLDMIKKLVDEGANPIAARCAVVGWKTSKDADTCKTISINSQTSK